MSIAMRASGTAHGLWLAIFEGIGAASWRSAAHLSASADDGAGIAGGFCGVLRVVAWMLARRRCLGTCWPVHATLAFSVAVALQEATGL